MKTALKLKLSSLIVVEQPLLTATVAVFFSAVIAMAALAIFQDYFLLTNVARCAFWALVALGVAHFAITKTFITRFSGNKHRIPLLYYGGRARIYKRPILKKVPFVEIIFPDNWDVNHIIGHQSISLLLRVQTSKTVSFLLVFDLNMEMFGQFQAKELENLISFQKSQRPAQKKFELVSCLEDFLVADIVRNHHSIKYLLEDYHLRQINLKNLGDGILQMVKIPNLFTNVKKMELRLSEVQRMVKLDFTVESSPFNKAAAAVL
jgi:hypothetical protein